MSSKGTVVITGAGSGIGRALTDLAASRGYDLALFDINGDELEVAGEAARGQGVRVLTRAMDVSDEAAISQSAEQVNQEFGSVRYLINNAGVALGGTFDHAKPDDFRWLMDINFYGVVNMTRAFLPLMKASEQQAQVVNISSIFGVIAPPGQTAYSSAKFAVRGFSEALRHELAIEGSNVGVTVVHPGGVATNIAKRARISDGMPVEQRELAQRLAEKSLIMPPSQAAKLILDAAEQGKDRLLVGKDAHLLATVQRLFPKRYWKIMSLIRGVGPAAEAWSQ
ncbi:MAG: SDR family NAD(P)-dependent oxidoreductase [Parvularculaceae bacterium]|nr:SDR family NAD(P)-dependent oxidoreductase [Parvularculaceae bacterium]